MLIVLAEAVPQSHSVDGGLDAALEEGGERKSARTTKAIPIIGMNKINIEKNSARVMFYSM